MKLLLHNLSILFLSFFLTACFHDGETTTFSIGGTVTGLEGTGFKGMVAGTAKYDDQVEMLKAAGLDAAFNIYGEAGAGFANHVSDELGRLRAEGAASN